MSAITPPPTTNALPLSQRTRLRKSSRKLEAVLGATPFVLEVNVLNDPTPYSRPPATPRTKAHRRRGQVFEGTSSSSSSSSDDDDDDDDTVVEVTLQPDADDYIFVSSAIPHGRYQAHSLPDAVASMKPGHRARSKSEVVFKPKYNKSKALPQPPLPTHIRIDLPLAVDPKSTQPVMITGAHHKSAASISSLASEPMSPRSPLSSVFNASNEEHDAKEARRKKLAKLVRTLGENVPPELVFRAPTKKLSISRPRRVSVRPCPVIAPSAAPTPPATLPKKFQRSHRPRSLSVPLIFPSPMIEIEQTTDAYDTVVVPSPVVIDLSPPTPLPVVEYSQAAIGYKRCRAANSMDSPRGRVAFEGLKTVSAQRSNSTDHLVLPKSNPSLLGRGAVSLDMPRPSDPAAVYPQGSSRSPMDYVYGKSRHTRNQTAGAAIIVQAEELHKRKEREWSGEWNVQDMGDVVRRLRELKGR